ncbi:MAG: hypothetical protein IPL10_15190 [Bacteroidetes bacterium]|nr:hypothetical protein [Bacteroidota bacterium]
MITQQDIQALCNSAIYAGFNGDANDIELIQWNLGIQNHIPLQLPANKAAVYIFKWNDTYLKVGKVNANSNARYQSQHIILIVLIAIYQNHYWVTPNFKHC